MCGQCGKVRDTSSMRKYKDMRQYFSIKIKQFKFQLKIITNSTEKIFLKKNDQRVRVQ